MLEHRHAHDTTANSAPGHHHPLPHPELTRHEHTRAPDQRELSQQPLRAFSNPSDQLERLRTLLELPKTTRPSQPPRPPKQSHKRLDRAEIAELVAAYKAGGRVKKLATRFGIHRTTVTDIPAREGVPSRPPELHP